MAQFLQVTLTPRKTKHLTKILDQVDGSSNLNECEQNLIDELRDQMALFRVVDTEGHNR
jgi:hypothetical protein